MMIDSQIDPPSQSHLSVLKNKFGHPNFRLKQWNVIDSVMNKKQDCVAIMATGHGKSICFQFAAVYTNKITIVISPLISLMIDQVTALNSANISACYLGSAQEDKKVFSRAIAGNYNLVYITPEFLTGDKGKSLLDRLRNKLNLIGIDEAHCVSQWGLDFRPAYRHLNIIRAIVPNVPILAVTATATRNVREDMMSLLNLMKPLVVCTGLDRPNLEFNCRVKGLNFWNDVKELFNEKIEGSIIVYVNKKDIADCFAYKLNEMGFVCRSYHGGLSIPTRKEVQKLFSEDKIKIVVATIAFGMGIDKSDVRMIIQYGAPSSIESYYQQVGRAGRDGKKSKCYCFHGWDDYEDHKYLRNCKCNKTPEQLKYLENLGDQVHNFVNSSKCRRQQLIEYFEGKSRVGSVNSNCCDNCNFAKKQEQFQQYENESYYESADEGYFQSSRDESDVECDNESNYESDATQMEIDIQKSTIIKIKRGHVVSHTVTSVESIRYGRNEKRTKKEEYEDDAELEINGNDEGESEGFIIWKREILAKRPKKRIKIEPKSPTIWKREIKYSPPAKKIKIEPKSPTKGSQRKMNDFFKVVK